MSGSKNAQVDVAVLSGPQDMAPALSDGGYGAEICAMIADVLRPGDKVLDLGAGLGVASIAAGQIVGLDNVTPVEPDEALIPCLRQNLRMVFGQSVHVLPVRAWPDDQPDPEPEPDAEPGQPPTRRLSRLLRRSEASVIVMDVAGDERDLLAQPLPETVRAVIVALHPWIYGRIAFHRILSRFERSGWQILGEQKGASILAFIRPAP